MVLHSMNTRTSSSHRQRLWIPLLIAFVVMCGFLLPLTRPERAETHSVPVAAASALSSPTADLEIIQTGPITVSAGDQISYTVVVRNKAGDPVSGVVLTDTWVSNIAQNISSFWPYGVLPVFEGYEVNPPGAVITFAHEVNDLNKRGEATWWLNPILANDSVEIVFTVTVPITLQPTLDNYIAAPLPNTLRVLGPSTVENGVSASVEGQEFYGNLSTAQVVAPLLLLTQSAQGEGTALNQARVGRLLTYTIAIENVSTRTDSWPATNLVITERLPIDVQSGLVAATASEPGVTWTYSEATGMLVWQFVPTFVLTRGETAYVYYTVRVPADLAYNPPTKYLIVYSASSTGDLRGRASLMPFREASLRSDNRVALVSPFDKTVATLSPPVAATATFANRPITYTLTYYSPISATAAMTLEDRMYDTFIYSHTASGGLPVPEVNGPQLLWRDVVVPGYGVISTTFVVTVSADTPVRAGGNSCSYFGYPNAVTATSQLFPAGIYVGHNNNKLAEVRVEPQLKVTKSVVPTSQIPGQNVTYKITVQNVGNTTIPIPIVVTDTLPTNFVYVQMASDPPPGDPVVDGNVLVWSDIPTLTGGANFIFYFEAEVDGLTGEKFKNIVVADSPEVPPCQIETAEVTILSPFTIAKAAQDFENELITLGSNVFPLVRQGDLITFTPSILSIAPRTTYTITQFRDVLDNAGTTARDRTGLINPETQGLEYTYTLPVPYVLQPEGSWEHVFTATMQGFGTGNAWCDDKEQIGNARVEQAVGAVEFTMESGVASNAKTLAQTYIIPHVSLFQQAYPSPVAIGEIVTVVLTLRDNRTNPITPATGINLLWTLPTGFELIDTDPMTTSSNAISASWTGVDLPLSGELQFLIHMRAPYHKEDGWKATYSATAQVVSMDDMNICIPKATRFIRSKSGAVGPDYEHSLPGPIPDWNDQYFYALEVNQGIEMDKVAKPTEIGPYGMVEYTLIIRNLTGAPVSSIVITDILPYLGASSWDYLETIDGIEPHGEDPLYWNIGAIEPLNNASIVIKTRSTWWLGIALNKMIGSAPINVAYNRDYTTHMSVNVVSGIGLYKVVEPTSILAGEATTYTIHIYNGAAYDILPMIVTDTLPLGFSFEEMVSPPTLQPVVNGQQLVWTINTKIAKNGGRYDIIFRARTATEGEGMFTGKYYNDVIASAKKADTGEAVEMPPTGPTAPVDVEGLPTVNVVKTATPHDVAPGQNVVYDIALHNEALESRILQITDTLPMYFTLAELISPTQATTSYAGSQQQIIWHDIPIGGQSSLTLTFRAHVAETAPSGRYGNIVQIQIDTFALPPSEPMANVWVEELPRTDAKVSKTDGSAVAQKGTTINYTIAYTNASADVAFQSVVLTETISPITYVTVLGSDWLPLGDGRFRREIAGPLNPGASGTTQFSVQLAGTIPADFQWVNNQVEIGYTTEEPTVESTPGDNIAEDVDLISGGESIVALKEAAYAGEMLLAGQELTYTITLFNAGAQAQTVRVTDTLPVSFTLSAAVSPPIEMTQIVDDQQQVVWDGITIPPQTFAYIIFRARVDPAAAAATACNVVQVQRGDGVVLPPTEPQACVDVHPLQRVDAHVSKTDNTDWALPGDTLLYRIQYGNAATSEIPLATIVLTETVSPPEVIDSIISAGWQKIGEGQYRSTTLSGLPVGGSQTAYFEVKLKDTIPTTITAVENQVEIGYTTAEPAVETSLYDNIGIDITVLQHDPNDVIVSKSAALSGYPARPGDFVTYTISLINGTSNVYTSRVTDTLPLNFTYAGAVYPTTGITTLWDGGRQLVVWDTLIPPGTTMLIFRAQIGMNAPSNRYYNAVQVQRDTTVQPKVTGLAPIDVVSGFKAVDAQVTKSDGRTSATAGEILTYTITYANAATSELPFETIILTETITPIDYLTVQGTGWTSIGGGRYTRVIPGPLTPGVSREVQFVVQIDAPLPDTVTAITNTVEIDYTTAETSTELILTNNTYTDITSVGSTIIIVPGGKIYLPLVLRNY